MTILPCVKTASQLPDIENKEIDYLPVKYHPSYIDVMPARMLSNGATLKS